ncbi:iron-sulfur protein [Nocardioides szechwanensis]|uniref:Ferredoxin subunit of nitrite reductase or a ring-hydroxylating dioxygenase n=1 Tax=Nocardioides szechwanensis TaxID=1005944 RepID=A0A1G9WRN6_9ACTN|nr:Rieske 2Fe-2S domain-containing protein [Nocardioides szechwanensis]GEP32547.1 iron-sulfur protein [Nocardioides szechwanensis]SDM87107.1 Ferredoxin subunit of nitrite reductase or a ring-hydroxylating dioxygenase [Nocardioides szechwanensis]
MGSSGLSRRRALTGMAGVSIGLPVLAACGGDDEPTPAGASDPPTPSASPSTSGSVDPSPTAGGAGFASTADIPVGGGAVFADEGVVVTQPEAGTFKGFDVRCTHAGCPVNQVTSTINCPCHGSKFSIVDGVPQEGSSATDPLSTVALDVVGDQISLA